MKQVAIHYVDPKRYDAVYIDWTLGNFCNFKCSYCPDYLHNGSNPMSDIETAKTFVKKLFNHYKLNVSKKYFVFNFFGGEPTLWKSLGEFVQWIHEYSQELGVSSIIEILTNGSRTIRWWGEYVKYFDIVKITHHTEFADPQHTLEVADLIVSNGKIANVQLTMIPALWNSCIEHLNIISKSKHQFQIDVKPLRIDFGSKLYDYSFEQLEIFKQPYRKSSNMPHVENVGMGSKFLLSDNTEVAIRYQDLITKKENSWLGWKCWAGVDIISIKQDGSIQIGGACAVVQKGLSNKLITDADIVFPTDPVICNQEWCSCGPDMETRKEYVK